MRFAAVEGLIAPSEGDRLKNEIICGHDSTICRGPGICMNCKFWESGRRRFVPNPGGSWPYEKEVWVPPFCNCLSQSLDDIVVSVCTLKNPRRSDEDVRLDKLAEDLRKLESRGVIRVITR